MTSITGQTTLVGSSATLSRSGSSQSALHSQCESRNVNTVAVAASAPRTLDLIKPSLFSLRITRTLCILDSSSPSSAAKKQVNCRGTVRCSRRRLQVLSKSLGYNWCLGEESIIYKRGSELTMITEIVDQYNFLDQMFRTPVQHAEIENEFSVISFSVLAKDSLNDRNKRNFLTEIKRF